MTLVTRDLELILIDNAPIGNGQKDYYCDSYKDLFRIANEKLFSNDFFQNTPLMFYQLAMLCKGDKHAINRRMECSGGRLNSLWSFLYRDFLKTMTRERIRQVVDLMEVMDLVKTKVLIQELSVIPEIHEEEEEKKQQQDYDSQNKMENSIVEIAGGRKIRFSS